MYFFFCYIRSYGSLCNKLQTALDSLERPDSVHRRKKRNALAVCVDGACDTHTV